MTPEKRALLLSTRRAEVWLRRRDGQPKQGIPINRRALCAVLSVSDAVATGTGGLLTWRADGHVFTAEPVSGGAAGAAEH